MKPFLPRIVQAESKHSDVLAKFLRKREFLKDQVKDSTILATLEAPKKEYSLFQRLGTADENFVSIEESDAGRKRQNDFNKELCHLLYDIETKFLAKEGQEVDRAETQLLFIRNQFVREFKRVMETDESRQLKANMIACSKVFKGNLNRLNCEWSDFVDSRLQKIIQKYYK
jgi:hypothetical protein